jgi:hypothetical protein
LASLDVSGMLQLTDTRFEVALERACAIANRNLTRAEWSQIMGTSVPYRRTCPDLPSGV